MMVKYMVLQGKCCRCGSESRTALCAPCIIAEESDTERMFSPGEVLSLDDHIESANETLDVVVVKREE